MQLFPEVNYQLSEIYQSRVKLLEVLDTSLINYYTTNRFDVADKYQRRINVMLKIVNKVECIYLYCKMKVFYLKVW